MIHNILVLDISAAHQLLCESLPIFLVMLFAPWALDFDFSSDLDVSAQGQAMIVLFIKMHFDTIFSKIFIERLQHGLIIIAL